jgi:hypothetical protein
MRKTTWIVIATTAALMLGFGGWLAFMPRVHAIGSTGLDVGAIQTTKDAKSLPIQHFDDYSLVFF